MASALAYADEAMPYGAFRGMSKSLDDFLKKADPRDHRACRENSSWKRGQRRALHRSSPDLDLINELARRLKAERKRILARERQQRRRMRLSRERL